MNPLNNMVWERLHPRADIEMLGAIPAFLDLEEPGDAIQQLDRNYQHGGGFHPTSVEFKIGENRSKLIYGWKPGEGGPEVYPALFRAKFRDDWVYIYNGAWVAVFKSDGSHVIARMD